MQGLNECNCVSWARVLYIEFGVTLDYLEELH